MDKFNAVKAKIYLSIVLLFQIKVSVFAQTDISLKVKVSEVNPDKIENNIQSIEKINDSYASISWNNSEVIFTFLSDNMSIQSQKRIKIFNSASDSLRIEELYIKGDEAFALTKCFLVAKNRIQYWIYKIDLETFDKVDDKMLISESQVNGWSGFYGTTLNLDFNGSVFSIFSTYIGEKNIQNGLLKTFTQDFEIAEERKFVLEKLKPTHGDYLRILDAYSDDKHTYFLVSGSKLKVGFSYKELVTGIITLDYNGDVISKSILPNEEVRLYDNLSIRGSGENIYIAGTFQGNKANPKENGFYLGVLDSETGELIHNSQTSVETVYDYENLSGFIKRMLKLTKDYREFNFIYRKAKIFFLDNKVTVIHPLGGFDGTFVTYFSLDAIIGYNLSGEFIKGTYLQQNYICTKADPRLYMRFYLQISDKQILVFYAKKKDSVDKNHSLSEEPLVYIRNNNTKGAIPVYSVINSELHISKPKLVMPTGQGTVSMQINRINSFIFNEGSDIEIVTFLDDIYKNRLIFTKIDITP